MLKYIVKRTLQAIPLMIGITALCFLLINLAPYDAVDAITTDKMTQEEIEAKREAYGLNDPIYMQYFYWIANVAKGELGYSLINGTNISEPLKNIFLNLSLFLNNSVFNIFSSYNTSIGMLFSFNLFTNLTISSA